MDHILKSVLKGAQISVDYSIKMYNEEKDIRFIDASIEGLNEMISSMEEVVRTKDMNDFLITIKEMRDKLNAMVESHKNVGVYYKKCEQN